MKERQKPDINDQEKEREQRLMREKVKALLETLLRPLGLLHYGPEQLKITV